MDMAPSGLLHLLPVSESLQTELQHPVRLALLGRYEAHDVLIQAVGYYLGMHVGGESVLIFLLCHLAHELVLF